jgi:hypothetical protein
VIFLDFPFKLIDTLGILNKVNEILDFVPKKHDRSFSHLLIRSTCCSCLIWCRALNFLLPLLFFLLLFPWSLT